jgi:hypothetical protein
MTEADRRFLSRAAISGHRADIDGTVPRASGCAAGSSFGRSLTRAVAAPVSQCYSA